MKFFSIFFHLNKLSIRYELSNLRLSVTFLKIKYGLNRINIGLFTQEAGWLGGNWIKLHTCVEGSNFTNDIHCFQHCDIN